MARVKLTEYRAKKLLVGEEYAGVAIRDAEPAPAAGTWVLKVDQGVKKRMKQGLVKVGIDAKDIPATLAEWKAKGFSRFIAEPLLLHEGSEERYLSLERVREGIRIMYAAAGGIEIETHPESVQSFMIKGIADASAVSKETGIPDAFLNDLINAFDSSYFGFLEINPLVVQDGKAHLLDAAVLADDAALHFVRGKWSEADIPERKATDEHEAKVAELQRTTPASLKLTVLNPDGSLFFLLSGGGGSIVAADEAALLGHGKDIGNYGEYSGGPSREETYLYAKEVLALMIASRAPKKALVIAGGIANFTDIRSTFAGIVDALSEVAEELRKAGVKVFIRRGGPNEAEGLAHMRDYLEREGLLGSVHGSESVITEAVREAVAHIAV